MEKVYLLHHVHASKDLEGEENVKLIGVYSSRSLAETTVERLKGQLGFKDYPKVINPLIDDEEDGFYIDEYEINKDHWIEGFVTI